MKELNLVKITDTLGKVTGEKGKITYQALDDKQLDNLLVMESGYSWIGYDFKVEMLGNVVIPGEDLEENECQ